MDWLIFASAPRATDLLAEADAFLDSLADEHARENRLIIAIKVNFVFKYSSAV